MPDTKGNSLPTLILELMHQQKACLADICENPLDGLTYCNSLPGTTIEIKCSHCSKALQMDTQPRWSVNRLDHYVANYKRCYSKQCGRQRAMQIPKIENLRWTCAGSASLKATHTSKPFRSWKGLLMSDPKRLEHLPCPVYCQCIHDRTRYVDSLPQWAPGDPPNYVEKRTNCNTCISQERSPLPRYIPEDPAIPSVPTRLLQLDNVLILMDTESDAGILCIAKSSQDPKKSFIYRRYEPSFARL